MAGLKRRMAHDETLRKADHTRLLQVRSHLRMTGLLPYISRAEQPMCSGAVCASNTVKVRPHREEKNSLWLRKHMPISRFCFDPRVP